MYEITGGCHCGSIEFSAELSREPSSYHPRACDCDFCRKHGAAYVSDPSGRLRIKLTSQSAVSRYRQGSGAAECLICTTCGVLVVVLYRADQVTYGAINARAANGLAHRSPGLAHGSPGLAHGSSGPAAFGDPTSVSPKMLSATQKVDRWQDIWFPHVDVSFAD
jgi:hypothetical protein